MVRPSGKTMSSMMTLKATISMGGAAARVSPWWCTPIATELVKRARAPEQEKDAPVTLRMHVRGEPGPSGITPSHDPPPGGGLVACAPFWVPVNPCSDDDVAVW